MENYRNTENIENQETIKYQGKIFEVVSEPVEIDGKKFEFEKVRRSPGVRLIIRDKENNFLLTREFRRELSKFDYRLPGGKVFDSLNEFNDFKKNNGDMLNKAKEAALKEAREETGFNINTLEHNSTSQLGATVEWDLHYFSGSVDRSEQKTQELEIGENIEVTWLTKEEVEKLILESDQFSEERSAATLIKFLHKINTKPPFEETGSNLINLIESRDLSSIRLRTKNLEKIKQISNIMFVGSSLVGKSTLVDAIRDAVKNDSDLSSIFQIPKRVITRPQRDNDNLTENQFVDNNEFDKMIENGNINLHWVRKMEENREERYGFLNVDKEMTPIFSANNAIINNKGSVIPPDLLEQSLIIAVYSPDDLRDKRMQERSPDLIKNKPEETKYRLSDKAINMYPEAHLIVKNFGHYQDTVKEDVVNLLRLISELKSK